MPWGKSPARPPLHPSLLRLRPRRVSLPPLSPLRPRQETRLSGWKQLVQKPPKRRPSLAPRVSLLPLSLLRLLPAIQRLEWKPLGPKRRKDCSHQKHPPPSPARRHSPTSPSAARLLLLLARLLMLP